MRFKAISLLLSILALWGSRSSVSADLGVCSLPPDGGPCYVLEERWFFNMEAKGCEPFNYGGCGGNENNFNMRENCEVSCGHYG
ncbi:kunitz-like toxin PcKuz2 [Hemicordylus capensis]|uniref:kunitz-like toxin PcKuz2 n=1 Tax=Hemicordylus capensis TaxID=884348 RepID=UPI002302ED2C|nr:kunitz-like toxin PcKuz2 [Hemicordylus capensis]XP_053103585.1 kunitz-like toxin PcKuz2 [Hemicordylus capensis]